MKLLACLIASSLVLTACGSSEVSPIEKRNLFDACVLKWLTNNGYDFIGYNGSADTKAKSECAYHLE